MGSQRIADILHHRRYNHQRICNPSTVLTDMRSPTRQALPYFALHSIFGPTLNVRQLLRIRTSNQHSFDSTHYVSITLFISHKVTWLFSFRRPFLTRSETRRSKNAGSAPSCASAVYLGHDQPHHRHQHYYQRNHAQSHVSDRSVANMRLEQ